MKTNYKMALAVLAGALIGVGGGSTIHARQVKAAPAFLISEADELDVAGLQKYGEKVPETLTPFNGHYHFLVAGAKAQTLDGEAPKGIVVIAFGLTLISISGRVEQRSAVRI